VILARHIVMFEGGGGRCLDGVGGMLDGLSWW
jgi:hypothetical protein